MKNAGTRILIVLLFNFIVVDAAQRLVISFNECVKNPFCSLQSLFFEEKRVFVPEPRMPKSNQKV